MSTASEPRKGRSAATQYAPGRGAEADENGDELIRQSSDKVSPKSLQDIMLDVRKNEGTRCAFSYAYLTKIEYEPGDTLRLFFGTDIVRIEGRCLSDLYEKLTQHKKRFVQEGSEPENKLRSDGEEHIESIEFEEVTEKDERRGDKKAK